MKWLVVARSCVSIMTSFVRRVPQSAVQAYIHATTYLQITNWYLPLRLIVQLIVETFCIALGSPKVLSNP